jgi:putative thioredoxin
VTAPVPAVIDVGEEDFQAEVLDRSASLPVVVDFWAAWCAPCRALTPVIEKVARAHAGRVVLAKLDADSSPNLVGLFGVHGIPAVKAFRDGEVIAEFVGARPPEAVESFFAGLSHPGVDELIAAGDEPSLRRALELEPRRTVAAAALARLLHERGDGVQALALLGGLAGSRRADGAAARIRLEILDPPLLTDAFAALDAGDLEHAVDLLLAELPSAGAQRADVHRVIAAVLTAAGVDHPLARAWRARLSDAVAGTR